MSRITGMLMGLLLCAAVSAAVPETPRFRLFGVAAGMPSSSITALARDRAGYLWIATPDGLARYDGTGFRIWRHDPDIAGSLPGNVVQALHIDARDRIWVATEFSGISMLDATRSTFRHWRQADHPQIGSDDTWAFASRGDTLWFGTAGAGLHRLEPGVDGGNDQITRFHANPESPDSLPSDIVLALVFDLDGELWIGTHDGLARTDGKTVQRVPLPGSKSTPFVFFLQMEGDTLWIGTSAGVFRRARDGRWSQPAWSRMFESHNAVLAMTRDRNGALWIGSQRGLWRTGADGIPAPVATGGPEIHKSIPALLMQGNGALWVPVAGVGLGYLRSDWQRVAEFKRAPEGLSADLYRALTPARDGGFWLAGSEGEVERLDASGALERLDAAERERLGGIRFLSIAEDGQGRLWLGHRQGLLRVARDGTVEEWNADDAVHPVPTGPLDLLRIAPDGSLWLSSAGSGIQQRAVANGRILRDIPAGPRHGLGVGDTEAIGFAADGSTWIAGGEGVSRLDPDRGVFKPVPGLGGNRVHAFAFDGPDTIWLHRLPGLERYRRHGDRWQRDATVGVSEGIPAVEAGGLQIDRRHRVWLSTSRGLFRRDPVQRHTRRFGLQDGLSSQEFVQLAFAMSDAGVLLAALADGGVALVDTLAPEVPAMRPDLHLDSLAVRRDGRWQQWPAGDALQLDADDRELRVRMRLLSFDDPQANRYWSRLDGFDKAWVAQGASGERVFTGLAPRRYRLRMRAVDAAGNTAREQTLRFRVLPPWWSTLWARVGFITLSLLLLWAVADAYRAQLKRRHAMQLAEQKRAFAEHASQAKTRFLATLGHEVRTPMTGVLGMSELLLGTSLDTQQRAYTESIRGAGNHLLRLVNDALDLARIESGKLELDVHPFVLRALVDDVVALMAPLAGQKGLQFDVTVGVDAPIALHGDAMRIRQILMNLLGNAIKFTRQGTVSLRVCALQPPGLFTGCVAGVRLEVGDTGPGLNDEQKARLFQRFEQAEGARTATRYGGSGLGLAISQELAAAMGGRIEVQSTPGQGARFTVDLPLTIASMAEAPGVAATALGTLRALDLLLVEDDPTVAAVIAGLLRAQGHLVTHVAHGLAALVETGNARFDIVMLDLDLPGVDGLALALQLRAQGFVAPLLAVTARADADAEPQSRAAGFDGFLRKPLTGELLAAAIRDAIGHDNRQEDTQTIVALPGSR